MGLVLGFVVKARGNIGKDREVNGRVKLNDKFYFIEERVCFVGLEKIFVLSGLLV